jgi:vitamin K-dependent gamma-carboxylase
MPGSVVEETVVPEVQRERRRPVERLFERLDIAPLVFFRVTFGFLMLLEMCRYIFGGMLRENWIDPRFQFVFFEWVPVPPGSGVYALGWVMLLAAAGVTVGWRYRTCAVVFGLGFTWLFLIEQSHYLNHFYLICLLSFAAALVPANRAASVDCRREPALRSDWAPAWSLWLIQAHMAIAYFYGGIAKLNSDWLRGEPIRSWMQSGGMSQRMPEALKSEATVWLLSYGGVAFDLLIVPLLIWRRTRLVALGLAIFFHLANARLFSIGLFPFLSIALTLLFLPPEWHRLFLGLERSGTARAYWPRSAWIPAALAFYFAVQLLLPFRHWLYAGNVHWTEEGHRFAWHMMLRGKTGETYYVLREGERIWRVDPREFLTDRQYRKMAGHPAMILQFAHYLRDELKPREVAVHAVAWVSLNGRAPALLIDPEVNLARTERSWGAASWILPLENKRTVPEAFLQLEDGTSQSRLSSLSN